MAKKTSASVSKTPLRKKAAATKQATSIVDEVEKVSETVLTEVRHGLGLVAGKITDVAQSGAETVAESQAGHLLKSLAAEVQEIGEGLVTLVAKQLERIRGKALAQAATTRGAARKKAAKKATAKKKPPVRKKTANKKTTKKKTTAKKTVARKKVVGSKKAVAKKAPAKKAAAKKKAPVRRKAASKKAR